MSDVMTMRMVVRLEVCPVDPREDEEAPIVVFEADHWVEPKESPTPHVLAAELTDIVTQEFVAQAKLAREEGEWFGDEITHEHVQ